MRVIGQGTPFIIAVTTPTTEAPTPEEMPIPDNQSDNIGPEAIPAVKIFYLLDPFP
jgi:hypothetical protein